MSDFLKNEQSTGSSLSNGQNTGSSLSNDRIQETLSRLIGTGLTPKQAIQSYQELDTHQNKIDHEKKGLEFSIGLVKGLLSFLVFVSLVKLMKQAEGSDITIDLNEYFSLLLPIITTALGYILGKKSN